MVQFNLLPDVKLEYVKTQRVKHLLSLVSFVVAIAGIAVLLLSMLTVYGVQKKSLHDLDSDIKKYSDQLNNVKDLDKILTVQNQLNTMTGLHDQKPVTNRLFGYVAQLTPADASLNRLNIDFSTKVITVGGEAASLEVMSRYTDTLKATKYVVGTDSEPTKAFTNVVLSSFGRSEKKANFTITFTFDDALFASQKDVKLVVPKTAGADQSNVFGEEK